MLIKNKIIASLLLILLTSTSLYYHKSTTSLLKLDSERKDAYISTLKEVLTTTQSSISICESVNVFNQDSFKYIKDDAGRVDSAVVKFNDGVNTHNGGGDVKSIVVDVISDELNSLLTEAYNSIYLQEGDGGSP